MLSGTDEQVTTALGEYGRLIGLAFQVFDDILDFSADEEQTGKWPGRMSVTARSRFRSS